MEQRVNEVWLDMNRKEKLVRHCKDRSRRSIIFKEFRLAQHLFDNRFRYFERKERLERCEKIEQLQTNDPKQFWDQLKSFGPRKKKVIPTEVYVNENMDISNDPEVVINRW